MAERPTYREQAQIYRQLLLDDIVPYWEGHVDWEYGGVRNCIRDDGTLVSDDKYLRSQARALWVYSKLYNVIEPRSDWLDTATNLYRFLAAHGRDDAGDWLWRVTRTGQVVEGATSIGSHGFALLGLAEYYRATGDPDARRIGLETYHRVVGLLAQPGSYGTAPRDVPPGMKAHSVSMMYSLAFWEFGQAVDEPRIIDDGYCHTLEVMNHYRRPELQALLEYIALDNRVIDSPAGRCIVPGHAIESMWFQMHILHSRGEEQRVAECVECIRWHIERGWDDEYGGILLSVDLHGVEPGYRKPHDAKTWWQHTEALYALMLAYEYSGEPWCLDWYWKVHDWAFQHFPDPSHGEWVQGLDRQGRPTDGLVELPVKDPFHLPRAAIYMIDVLERLATRE